MANSNFPLKTGSANGGNAALINALRSGGVIRNAWMPIFLYSQLVSYSDFSDSDTSEELDLNATFTSNLFPANVVRRAAYIYVAEDFAGGSVSAATVELGDTGDPNGLLTSTNVFTGATNNWVGTPAAAEAEQRVELAFAPTLTLTTTDGNIDTLTAGKVLVCIEYSPLPNEVTS